jgi:NAD(P)-dependent dehydrogenase (short-subunit alcohol dehydrogenase family)
MLLKSGRYWFSKSVALELGSRIRCNVIAPIYRNGNDGQIKRRCGKGWREESIKTWWNH